MLVVSAAGNVHSMRLTLKYSVQNVEGRTNPVTLPKRVLSFRVEEALLLNYIIIYKSANSYKGISYKIIEISLSEVKKTSKKF